MRLTRSCAELRLVPAALLAVAVWLVAGPALGQTTARALYARAEALGQTLPRDGAAAAAALGRFHRTVAAYELVVRRFPRSGYCDNALWKAAEVSAEAARRFGRASDRTKAGELLAWLAREYPGSALARQARTRLSADAAAPRTRPAPPPSTGDLPPQPPRPAVTESPQPAAPSGASPRGEDQRPASVRSVRRTVMADVVRVTIELDREVPFTSARLERPPRVQVDFESSMPAADLLVGTLTYRDGQVSHLRIARPGGDRVRILLDLDDAPRFSVFPLYDPFRLVVDVDRPRTTASSSRDSGRPGTPPAAATLRPPPLPDRPSRPLSGLTAVVEVPVTTGSTESSTLRSRSISAGLLTLPTVVSEALSGTRGDAGHAESPRPQRTAPAGPAPIAARPTAPVLPPGAPAANSGGGFSMARQLGLGISRVVIDPGHGGHDPGALGKGVTEAEVVLDIALRLEKLLVQQGIEVVFTRRGDEYVALEERTAIANRSRADLFVSIHANASRNPQARGVETYFLNFASNPDAEAVAARENASSARTMASLSDIVRAIALNAKLDESRDLAGQVQRAMVRRLRGAQRGFRDLGVKQAPFVVLIGATMPSVLAEVSFLTHNQESKLLRTPAYRQKVAEALLDGLRRYQTSLKTARADIE